MPTRQSMVRGLLDVVQRVLRGTPAPAAKWPAEELAYFTGKGTPKWETRVSGLSGDWLNWPTTVDGPKYLIGRDPDGRGSAPAGRQSPVPTSPSSAAPAAAAAPEAATDVHQTDRERKPR